MTWYEYEMTAEGFEIRQELEWDKTRSLLQMIYNTSTRTKNPISDRKKLIYLPYIDDKRPVEVEYDYTKMKREMEEVVKKRLGK